MVSIKPCKDLGQEHPRQRLYSTNRGIAGTEQRKGRVREGLESRKGRIMKKLEGQTKKSLDFALKVVGSHWTDF